MKNRVSYSFLVIFFLLFDFVAFAQGPGDEDGGGGLEGNDPPPAPINGQLIWLGVLAIIFAYYSIRRYRKLA
jgi:hypothetical protein